MSSPSETSICNMALARLGAKRITSLTDASNEANHCALQYEPVRDALLRSHSWAFALSRASLSEDTAAPAFEFDNAFLLPSDCLRVVSLYYTDATYRIEGKRLLTNDDEAQIVYIRRVTDPTEFDPLFVKVLACALAIELVMPLSQDKTLRDRLEAELSDRLSDARLANLIETNTTGTADLNTWINARINGVT